MKSDPQAYKRQSSRGLFLMCAGAMAVLLSDSILFLVLGGALEVFGLLLFVGGMWRQKKQRDAELAAAQSPAADTSGPDTPDASGAPDAPSPDADAPSPDADAPSPDADAPESRAPQTDPAGEKRPGWEYDS